MSSPTGYQVSTGSADKLVFKITGGSIGSALSWFIIFNETTIWLFNSSPWKDPPFLRTVNHHKPSISMGHLYHGYVC